VFVRIAQTAAWRRQFRGRGVRRLPSVAGEWIDRERTLPFTFEGRSLTGLAGDVISSALAANDVRIVGRSFKYHRPRGLLSFANGDVNALVQAGERLNLRADVTPLEAGMQLHAVNTFGGLARDRARVLNALAPFLPVGFYYKAFHSKRLFPLWERLIRRASGLGVVASDTQRLRTPKRYAFCDVLVIGAGPSGLSAALSAADSGARVAIVDENARLGGSGLFDLGGGFAQRDRTRELVAQVLSHSRIRSYPATTAAGYYADHWVPLVEPTHITKMRAGSVVFATGALEQPAVFRNNDLPGVMLASAAQRLIYRYAVAPGSCAVILAANEDAYRAARDLMAHGIAVAAVVDLRTDSEIGDQITGTRRFTHHGIYEAVASNGTLASVRIAPLRSDGDLDSTRCLTVNCDLLLMSTGWAPALNLARQAGATLTFDRALAQFVPTTLPPGLFVCGRANGVYDFGDRCRDGYRAGKAAFSPRTNSGAGAQEIHRAPNPPATAWQTLAQRVGILERGRTPANPPDASWQALAQLDSARAPAQPAGPPASRMQPSHPFPIFSHRRGKNFVDFDEDLQLQDFFNAAQEGFDSVELLKRFSTFGMGPSQGKHSNVNASRVLAKIRGVSVADIGMPTSRPFYHPVPMSHLAGRAFAVERRTPLHSRHVALGARFMALGAWQRPEYYPVDGLTREQAIHAEAKAVREGVALIDVGTLGKIEARGADAGSLLDRAYTGRFSKLKIGMSRYGLMLDETGVIIDDGVIARITEDHYYFTTTTSGSANIYRELQRYNLLWNLSATLVNFTGHFSAVNLAGPRSRDVLATVCDLDLSDAAFPYLGARVGAVANVPVRLLRVGFVGELSYEIHAPADSIGIIWDSLMRAGAEYGIRPFGVEAQRLLRLEKGHIIIGQDTDGLTNPMEVGAKWALALDKPFFVGQRSLQVLAKKPPRQRLVGFRLNDPDGSRPLESHLIIASGEIAGRITSVAWSPTLQAVIGLAFVTPNFSALDSQLSIRLSDGSLITATVVATPFYDPTNSRQGRTACDATSRPCAAAVSSAISAGTASNARLADSQRMIDTPYATASATQSPAVSDVDLAPPSRRFERERICAAGLALTDLSSLARLGLKGPKAAELLRALRIPVPSSHNQWIAHREGIVGRLGASEFLLECAADDDWTRSVLEAFPAEQVAPVSRSDAALLIAGSRAHELLAQICSYDFGQFQISPQELVMTQMTGVPVIVISVSTSPTPAYRLWCDPTFADYLWHTLEHIAAEICGAPSSPYALTSPVMEQAP
jgi:sarcosine oxidase, subunit alpha